MTYTLLSALQLNEHYAHICVRVTRRWEYRGPSDDGHIQHVDLVLADHEANGMHAEIPQNMLQNFNNQIEEGQIYEISRFRVAHAKTKYKPIDGRYMIQFTVHTRIGIARNPPTTIPRYVYNLTPFEELPMLVGNFQNFIDVLAVIVEVNEPETVQISNNNEGVLTRKLVLQDANGLQTKMTLWGQRAALFSIDDIYNSNEAKPIITLFVGCLMKTYHAQDYLSGSYACKWYFDPDIPEAKELYDRYENDRIEIRRVAAVPQQVVQPPPPLQQELKYLHELQSIDPYDFPRNGCQCTVTIARLVPDVSWWYPSCSKCTKACSPENNGYICYPCNNSNYRPRYKLLFIATDGTAEAELICFGQIAQRIIGKPVEHVMRTFKRGEEFPPDIAGIVSQKYTFAITMTNQSYYTTNKSFMVNSIITSYGRQRSIPQLPGSSSSDHLNYHGGSGSSTPTKNRSGYDQKLIASTSTVQHTPPSSPAIVETSVKEAPPSEHIDTAGTNTTKKRLTYDDPEDKEALDHEQRKKTKGDKTKVVADPAIPRSLPEHKKAADQKSTASKESRLQKNK